MTRSNVELLVKYARESVKLLPDEFKIDFTERHPGYDNAPTLTIRGSKYGEVGIALEKRVETRLGEVIEVSGFLVYLPGIDDYTEQFVRQDYEAVELAIKWHFEQILISTLHTVDIDSFVEELENARQYR